MILREGRQAVITFIDYSVAFDMKSQMFLDEALAEAGVGAKVRRIVQAILAAATGVVRLRRIRNRIPQDKIPQGKIPQDKIPQHKKWTKSHRTKSHNIKSGQNPTGQNPTT